MYAPHPQAPAIPQDAVHALRQRARRAKDAAALAVLRHCPPAVIRSHLEDADGAEDALRELDPPLAFPDSRCVKGVHFGAPMDAER
ncbi:MAG TPA: hypothetical protein VFI96_04270, partial [Longimicrobiaceae bacterium]|nr:hypothetical protein [Longimicrobiaceae bacterium]